MAISRPPSLHLSCARTSGGLEQSKAVTVRRVADDEVVALVPELISKAFEFDPRYPTRVHRHYEGECRAHC
jgi:hypothetical protein